MSSDVGRHSWDQCMSMVQYCFTSTDTIRLVRTDSPGRSPRLSHSSWTLISRWGKKEIITYLSLHCHHRHDSCIKMGSDESHFNVSLTVRNKVTPPYILLIVPNMLWGHLRTLSKMNWTWTRSSAFTPHITTMAPLPLSCDFTHPGWYNFKRTPLPIWVQNQSGGGRVARSWDFGSRLYLSGNNSGFKKKTCDVKTASAVECSTDETTVFLHKA